MAPKFDVTRIGKVLRLWRRCSFISLTHGTMEREKKLMEKGPTKDGKKEEKEADSNLYFTLI